MLDNSSSASKVSIVLGFVLIGCHYSTVASFFVRNCPCYNNESYFWQNNTCNIDIELPDGHHWSRCIHGEQFVRDPNNNEAQGTRCKCVVEFYTWLKRVKFGLVCIQRPACFAIIAIMMYSILFATVIFSISIKYARAILLIHSLLRLDEQLELNIYLVVTLWIAIFVLGVEKCIQIANTTFRDSLTGIIPTLLVAKQEKRTQKNKLRSTNRPKEREPQQRDHSGKFTSRVSQSTS